MATRAEIEALTLEVKTLVAAGRVTFVPRQVNIEGMARLGVTTQEAETVLGRLTINN